MLLGDLLIIILLNHWYIPKLGIPGALFFFCYEQSALCLDKSGKSLNSPFFWCSHNILRLLKSLGVLWIYLAYHFLKFEYRLSLVTMGHSISLNTGLGNCCLTFVCLNMDIFLLIWWIFSPLLHTSGSLPHLHTIGAARYIFFL